MGDKLQNWMVVADYGSSGKAPGYRDSVQGSGWQLPSTSSGNPLGTALARTGVKSYFIC